MNSQSAVMTLFGSRGQAKAYDVFDRRASARNGVVVGFRGSGTSFCLNDQADRALAVGGKVLIVDVGQSYAGLCQLLSGQHFATNTGISVMGDPTRQSFMPAVIGNAIQRVRLAPRGRTQASVCKAGAMNSSSVGLHLVRKHVTFLKGLTP